MCRRPAVSRMTTSSPAGGGLDCTLRDRNRRLTGHDRQARDSSLVREHGELLLGGRALHVERGQERAPALLGAQPIGELGAGGGLARALQADHQDHAGRRPAQVELARFAAQQIDQVVVHDLDHHLAGRDAFQDLMADRALADRADEILDDRQRHAGLEQGDANVAQRRFDVGLAQRAAALQPIEDIAKTAGQAPNMGCSGAMVRGIRIG